MTSGFRQSVGAVIALAYTLAHLIHAWGFLAVFAAGVGLRRAELHVVAESPHPVRFRGIYDHADLDAVLGPVHVVVVPSLWEEAFGLVVQEALSRRRVVVASRTGGLAEQIQDGVNGYLVTPGDVAGLAAAIDAVAATRQRPALRLGVGIRAIGEEAEEWGRLYAQLAAGGGGVPIAAVAR